MNVEVNYYADILNSAITSFVLLTSYFVLNDNGLPS